MFGERAEDSSWLLAGMAGMNVEPHWNHWFVNDCCKEKFLYECKELGYRIDTRDASSAWAIGTY